MYDLKFLRENPDVVRNGLKRRHQDVLVPDVDRLLQLDATWRESSAKYDELRAEQNRVSKEIGALKREKKDASSVIARMQEVADDAKRHNDAATAARVEIDDLLLRFPNIPHASTPDGATAEDNPVIRTLGEPPSFDFEPKAHWDLGSALDILDLERAGKITGSGFFLLKGQGARLQRSLIQLMLDTHTQDHGYTEILPPFLVNRKTMTGTGQLPKFEDDLYRLSRQGVETDDPEGLNAPHANDLFLIPTAEVPVTNIHADEILGADDLPIRYTAYTPCFRREAGSAGRDTRGILRVHQFDKVELVKFTTPDASYDEHEKLLADAEAIMQKLELPYRVIQLCAGDLGFAAAKCYDIEVWAAGQQRWLEVSSVSNFEDFQSRRANIRYRPDADARPEFLHTLNGSGIALPRLVIALLENNQNADGSIAIPAKLKPYFGSSIIG